MYFESEKIYDLVDKMRLARGWSIYRLAELANISENSIYSWRDRHTMPTLNLIENIAEAFGVSPIVLLLNSEEMYHISNEQKGLLEKWNMLSENQKNSLMLLLSSFVREID